jgi:hypothetical protein
LELSSKPYFGLRAGWLTFWIIVACGTAMMLFGYDQGAFGGVIITEDFRDAMALKGDTHVSTFS